MTNPGELENGLLHSAEKPCWQFPDFVKSAGEVIDTDLIYNDELTKGIGRELRTEGVFIWYGQFQALSEQPLLIKPAGSHVQMNFSLQSTTAYFSETSPKPFVRFKAHQHNLLLLPERNMLVQWKRGEQVEVFSINLSTDFFFGNLPETHPLYAHFRDGIDRTLPAFMSWRNLPLTSKMISLLFEILNCSYSGYHKVLFVKAKVIELMALQFEQYEQLALPDFTLNVKESDKEKMHLARQIIAQNLDKTCSLKDLAHQVGTNEFNLKKYFKEVFGKPVFAYLHDLRMETSMQMLHDTDLRISEIAQKTGYKNPTHFTAAFKKYFNMLPNKVRVGLLNLIHFSEYLAGLWFEITENTSMIETL